MTEPADQAPKQREEVLNAKLGELLIERHPLWDERNVHIDSTGTIRGRAAIKIDVLVEGHAAQPVAIETKFDTSGIDKALHRQTKDRIGLTIGSSNKVIEAAISVKWPKGLKASGIDSANFRYAIYQLGANNRIIRWPERSTAWLTGVVDDLADAVEAASLSERRIFDGSESLRLGVSEAVYDFRVNRWPTEGLGEVLHQEPGEQTTRMAAAIVINAFLFHVSIEGRSGIPTAASAKGSVGFYMPSVALDNWDKILEVNYWPVFSIASRILQAVTLRGAGRMLDIAAKVAQDLMQIGATTFHDLAARMFQTLIADRKFLATFYTLPESASLLAELAVERMQVDWQDEASVKALKIADFACGTGTLLSAAQSAIYRKLRRSGLDDQTLHKHFMESVFLGTDIMPSAAHLATSMLSSAHPDIIYNDSLVHVMPYGRDEKLSKEIKLDTNRIYIGALDLRTIELSNMNLFVQSGVGEEVEVSGERMTGTGTRPLGKRKNFPVEHGSFDLVIMNPPFTRPTNHEGELGVPVPSFAGFNTSREEQSEMSKRLAKQKRRIFGHGNAGLASNFMDLAHDKLKEGGVLALVLPFTFTSGESWQQARSALSKHYRDISIVSIAASGDTDRAFSADTGMAECLVLATKSSGTTTTTGKMEFTNLERRPRNRVEAHEQAKSLKRLSVSIPDGAFLPAGVRDPELIGSMLALCEGELQLPRQRKPHLIPITELGQLANRGPLHRDINGADGRGAFDIHESQAEGYATYPTLWGHDADRERQFKVLPDAEAVPRPGCQDRAAEAWQRFASELHHNLDFRLNSQSMALCITPEPTLGGRAWPTLLPRDERHQLPVLLWGNSTLGLMLFWWHGTRQQQGRACLTISRLPKLPTIDCSALSKTQIEMCATAFEQLRIRRFRPANEAYRDNPRKLLDERLFEMLGLPSSALKGLDILREKWCREPSVHGGKSTRPGGT